MAFLEDPRLRQRWNQISHTTEAVTENAAAGIWSFGHSYVNPCLGSLASVFEICTVPCLGDREERARRARDRERARGNAEYSFDFYDDWDDDFADNEGHGGLLGGWRNEDWDRLLAGTGRGKRGGAGEIHEQPCGRKRGMSYGTRGTRRKSGAQEDLTIIPSTAPIGFLGKLPFKIGGTLRYKPSAANLQEHPGSRHVMEGEQQPLLGNDEDDYHAELLRETRKRSATAGSGATSDSYRSRGDLFPSDGEGDFEDDAVPLDDEFAVALGPVDDHSSSRSKSSKGKRIADPEISRSGSRLTIDSSVSRYSMRPNRSPSVVQSPGVMSAASLEDLHQEEDRVRQEQGEEIEHKGELAAQLATERGLQRDSIAYESGPEAKAQMVEVIDAPVPQQAELFDPTEEAGPEAVPDPKADSQTSARSEAAVGDTSPDNDFVPARLPYFR